MIAMPTENTQMLQPAVHTLELAHSLTTHAAIASCLSIHQNLRDCVPDMADAALTKSFEILLKAQQDAAYYQRVAPHHPLLTHFKNQLNISDKLLFPHIGFPKRTTPLPKPYQQWTNHATYAARASYLADKLENNQHPDYADDIADACRSNLNAMLRAMPQIATTDNCAKHSLYLSPEIVAIREAAYASKQRSNLVLTKRHRRHLPTVISGTLAQNLAGSDLLESSIQAFRDQPEHQQVLHFLDHHPPTVAFVYIHEDSIYAQEPHEPFTPGYPEDEATSFAQLLLDTPSPYREQQTAPYYTSTARLIRARVAAHTSNISNADIASIINQAAHHGATPAQHLAIIDGFAPTPQLQYAIESAVAKASRYTSNQIQAIIEAARTVGVEPDDIAYLVQATDHQPIDYGLPTLTMTTRGLIPLLRFTNNAGVHIDVAARIAASVLKDPLDVVHILDLAGYHTSRYTPP